MTKVEPPEGAPSRRQEPFYQDEPDANGSIHFWYYNTSKSSVWLDTDATDGVRELERLVADADVVIDGGEKPLRKILGAEGSVDLGGKIICRVTEFGGDGPWSGFVASDLVHLALGGIMASCGYDGDDRPPIAPSGGQSHHITGVNAATAILAALLAPPASSDTCDLDVSAHDCVTMATEMSFAYGEFQQVTPRRQTGRHARPYPTSPWNHLCKDGKYISCLPLYFTDDRFAAMVEWFDSHGLAGDLANPKYSSRDDRNALLDEIIPVIAEFCSHFDSDHIFHEAQRRRLPWAPVNHTWELVDDPHFIARDLFPAVAHEELGVEFSYPGAPYALSRTPWSISTAAPRMATSPDTDGGTGSV